MATGLNLTRFTGPDRYAEFMAATPNARWLFAIEGALVVTACALALWRVARRTRRSLDPESAAALMLVTWLTWPALCLTRGAVNPAFHYLTTVLPAPFMLLGWLAACTWRSSTRWARVGGYFLGAFITLLVAAQAWEVTSAFQFVLTRDTWRAYGTLLDYKPTAAQAAIISPDARLSGRDKSNIGRCCCCNLIGRPMPGLSAMSKKLAVIS